MISIDKSNILNFETKLEPEKQKQDDGFKLVPVEGFEPIHLTDSEEREAIDFLRKAIAYRAKNPL